MVEPINEMHAGRPHPRLRPFVTEYVGYRQARIAAGVHMGLPSRSLTCIVAFDERLDVTTSYGEARHDRYWGMLGGLHAAPAIVRHGGRQHGVQLAITPQGAATLFGVPAAALASQVVHLDEVAPAHAPELIDRLSGATSWRARWAILDDVLLRVMRDEVPVAPELAHAWTRLAASDGAVRIDELAAEVGWSRRHLTQRFTAAYGLTPKVMARVLRFERAQRLLRLPTRPSLASVAAASGYADQAHMTRDWNSFAGSSPKAWLTDEVLPFVQDAHDGAMSP